MPARIAAPPRWRSARSANFRSESTRAIPGEVEQLVVARDLVESRQQALRFRQELAVVIRFELSQGVVHAETVVPHDARQIRKINLLAGDAFEDVQELGSGVVDGVVELHLV